MALFKKKKEEFYLKNPKGNTLNGQQYFGISLGLIIGEQNGFYVDSLEPGSNTVYPLKQMMQNNWRIFDRNSALACIERIMNGKHSRHLFNRLLDICIAQGDFTEAEKIDFTGTEFEIEIQEIEEEDDENEDDCEDEEENEENEDDCEDEENYQPNWIAVLPNLQNLEEIMNLEDGQEWLAGDFDIHADAWDFGRIIFVCRAAFSLGYISEDEAWQYIDNVTDMAKKLYTNWEDYATSYLLGRAMWCGDDDGGWEDVMAFASGGLYDKQSPWKKLKW
ncbi:MAG: DUF1266 domain-containing protein [Prevotellaceae bacterium]|jgi:hypothetical protein|nr:DUF1266 domain-containing protein [Prevotellaceae bacterium]